MTYTSEKKHHHAEVVEVHIIRNGLMLGLVVLVMLALISLLGHPVTF